jgi:hypothetical protein
VLGVAWWTVTYQVIDRGVPLIADPARLAVVAAVGVDETGYLRGNATLSGSRTQLPPLSCGLGCAFILVDQASEDRSAPDSLPVEVRGGVIGVWRVGDHEIPQVGGVGDRVIPHPAIT